MEMMTSFSPAPYVAATLILLVLIAVKRRYSTSIRDVPGPFLASFSSLWQVYRLWKGDGETEWIRLHNKHGSFVRISEKEVSVSHPDAVKLLLQAHIHKAQWYTIFCLPDYTYVNQMAECDPKLHVHKQRNVAAGYALSNIIKSEPQVDALIGLLEHRLDLCIKTGQPVNFDQWFNFFAFDVVGEITFSQSFRFLETGTDIRNAMANAPALAIYIAVMGHYVWFHRWTLGNPLFSRLGVQPSSHIFDTCLEALERRNNNPEVRKDMVGSWLSVRNQNPDRMAESEVFTAATANLGAGAETMSATLQAFFYYMLRHPANFNRLREEIDAAHARGELSDPVSYAEAQKLPFLQACIKEIYRFHPAVAGPLPRIAPPEGITIDNRFFPSGTILSVNVWVFHRNPHLFGPDADVFNPERWLDAERVARMTPFLIHWGAGYNQCPGRSLAHFEVSKVAAQITRKYDIEQVEPGKDWKFKTRFMSVPYGWPCLLKLRDLGLKEKWY